MLKIVLLIVMIYFAFFKINPKIKHNGKDGGLLTEFLRKNSLKKYKKIMA